MEPVVLSSVGETTTEDVEMCTAVFSCISVSGELCQEGATARGVAGEAGARFRVEDPLFLGKDDRRRVDSF